MSQRCTRYKELQKTAFVFTWVTLFGQKARLIKELVVPNAVLIVVVAITSGITIGVLNSLETDDTNTAGYWNSSVLTPNDVRSVCYSDSDFTVPRFQKCFGIVNETLTYSALTSKMLHEILQDDESQYRTFQSYKEVEEQVINWTGDDNCETCEPATDFGYFLLFTFDDFGNPTWQIAVQEFDQLVGYSSGQDPASKLKHLNEPEHGFLLLLNYIYDYLGTVESDSGTSPDITPSTLPELRTIRTGNLSSKEDPNSSSSSTPSFSLSSSIFPSLLYLGLYFVETFSTESSITKNVLQSGMHQICLYISNLSYLLFHALVLILLSLLLWPIFPYTFESIYNSPNFDFGTGLSIMLLSVFGFLIQSSTFHVIMPSKAASMICIVVVEAIGLGVMIAMTMQDYVWPYALIAFLIPFSFCCVYMTNVSMFRQLAIQSSQLPDGFKPEILTDSNWKFNMYDSFKPGFPDKYLSPAIQNSLSDQYMSQILSLKPLVVWTIISILVHLVIMYVGLSIKPREKGGSCHCRNLFLPIPKGAKLKKNVDKRLNHTLDDDILSDNCFETIELSKYYGLKKTSDRESIKNADRLVETTKRCCFREVRTEKFGAVQDISVTFKSKQITGLLGVNGAGKSTLINMLLGLMKPSKGSINMLGEPILTRHSNVLDVLPLIGYVPQHNILGDFSCLLHCAIMAGIRGVPGGLKEWKEEALIALERVNLGPTGDDKANVSANALSGGQKRRLMIAMALSGRPPLLILDEPSAGLSADAKLSLNESLQNIRQTCSDETIIITEHDLEQVDQLCDEMHIMRDGRVVASGTSLSLKEQYGSGYTLRLSFEGTKHADDVDDSSDMDVPIAMDDVKNYSQNALELIRTFDTQAKIRFVSGRDVFIQLTEEASNKLPDIYTAMDTIKKQYYIRSFSLEITTLSDVFINIAENKIKGDGVINVKGQAPVITEHAKITYNQSFKILCWKSLISFSRSSAISFRIIGDFAVSIIMLIIFSVTMSSILLGIKMSSGPIVLSSPGDYYTNFNLGSLLQNIRWTASPEISAEYQKQVGVIMSAFDPKNNQFNYGELEIELDKDRERQPANRMLLQSESFDLTLLGSCVIAWDAPDSVSIYLPPEYYMYQFERNISSFPTLITTFIKIALRQAEKGYVSGDRNLLMFDIGLMTYPVRSLYGDPRKFSVPMVSSFMTMYSTLICMTLTSMAIVIPFLLASERTSGFALQLRLVGERKFSNMLSWFVTILLPGTIIEIVVVMLCYVIPVNLMINDENAPIANWSAIKTYCGLIVISCIPFTVTWAMFGVWLSYCYKSSAQALKVAPTVVLILLIPLIVIVAVMALSTSDMPLVEIRGLWSILAWVFGVLPFSTVPTLILDMFLCALLPEIFTPDFKLFGITLVTSIAFATVFTVIVFLREGIEHSNTKKHFPRGLVNFLSFGKPNLMNVPNPSRKTRRKLGCATPPEWEADDRHPNEDDTVKRERDHVHGDTSDAILLFKDCRREFRFSHDVYKDQSILVAVRDLDLAVEKGECLGLVGENGAGKTTALSMAIGTLKPTFGEALIKAGRVGYVPQFEAYTETLTVEQHIKLFSALSGVALDEALSLADFIGLREHMQKLPRQLSGGYKRRLSLSLALITSCELLVADEIAAGVDERARSNLIEILDSLKAAGCSVIVTSHNMETVDRIATRVAVLTKGLLRSVDTPDMLKQRYSSGLTVTMQLNGMAPEGAALWLAEQAGVDAGAIQTLPSLGGDSRFVLPKDKSISIIRMLSALRPSTRPEWILRSAVAQSSLESVFLALEKESADLGLTNIVTPETYGKTLV